MLNKIILIIRILLVIYFGLMFCTKDKNEIETLWYGIFLVVLMS